MNENIQSFELGIAVSKIYDFIWDCYCDWYIELAKARLQGEKAQSARQVLVWVLDKALKLLHPFMPFITETIWQTLPHADNRETIMLEAYPTYDESLCFEDAATRMEIVMEAIRAIRTRRSEMNVPPSRKAKVYIATEKKDVFEGGTPFIIKLASASEVEIGSEFEIDGAVTIVTSDAKSIFPWKSLLTKRRSLQGLTRSLQPPKSFSPSLRASSITPDLSQKLLKRWLRPSVDRPQRKEKNRAYRSCHRGIKINN